MPRFETRYFGCLDYDAAAVLRFPAGLPGFEDEKAFIAIEQPLNRPLVFLQSLSRPDLCFVLIPARAVVADYRLALGPEELAALELEGPAEIGPDLLCMAIVSPADGSGPTANLLAPVVIRPSAGLGVQAVGAGPGYSHRHPLACEPAEAVCS